MQLKSLRINLNPKLALLLVYFYLYFRIIHHSHTVLELCQGERPRPMTHKNNNPAFAIPYSCFSKIFWWRPAIFHGNSIFCTFLTSWMAQNLYPLKRDHGGSDGPKSTSIPAGDEFRICLVISSKHHCQTHHLSLIPEQNWGEIGVWGDFFFLYSQIKPPWLTFTPWHWAQQDGDKD